MDDEFDEITVSDITSFDAISDFLDVDVSVIKDVTPIKSISMTEHKTKENMDDDELQQLNVKYAQDNIKEIINKCMSVLPSMVRDLNSSENPKMYSGASEYIKTLVDINERYANINGGEKTKVKSENKSTTINTTNNLNMTTSELKEYMSK